MCACGTSNAPIVGTYKLVSVYMSNGTATNSYVAGDAANPLVTENSFVLKINKNYKWTMNIQLPGVTETEDGKWTDDNGTYTLKDDHDDPEIELTCKDNQVSFTMSEDGYTMNVVLKKVS